MLEWAKQVTEWGMIAGACCARRSFHAQSRLAHSLPILTFNQTVTECLDARLLVLYSKPRPRDSVSVGVCL